MLTPVGGRLTDVASNVWYGDLVGAERAPAYRGSNLAAAAGAVALFRRYRNYAALITSEGALRPVGVSVYALLARLTGRRNLVLVEFLPGRKRGVGGALMDWMYRHFLGPVVAGAQVMTEWERDAYVVRYALDASRVRHIPFYAYDDRVAERPVAPSARRGLLASGRNSCDWPTLIEAAAGQGWDLTIICPASDRAAIEQSAAAAGVRVLDDVPRAEHDRMLAEAALYLIVLTDQGGSSGHVRLASAATRHTPVIVSDVPGVRGYRHLAARRVAPGDPSALRAAVETALADPDGLWADQDVVVQRAVDRSYRVYTDEVAEFLISIAEPMNERRVRPTTTT